MNALDPFRQSNVPSLFHFTDTRNIDSIIATGGLYSVAELHRRQIQPAAPGGNQWSRDADRLKHVDKFVHLCFRPTHPMEFAARQDGRIKASLFLHVHPSVLDLPGVCFSADVANKSGVQILPIAEAIARIDFEVLYSRTDWSDPQIQARLRAAEKCEILVPNHVPLRLIRNLPNG